jgi:proteic killer suppression protein
MEELYIYNSLRYEKLKGDRQGFSSLRINDQYRLEFQEILTPGDQSAVELCSLTYITNHYK